jgi:hypothetical protein
MLEAWAKNRPRKIRLIAAFVEKDAQSRDAAVFWHHVWHHAGKTQAGALTILARVPGMTTS